MIGSTIPASFNSLKVVLVSVILPNMWYSFWYSIMARRGGRSFQRLSLADHFYRNDFFFFFFFFWFLGLHLQHIEVPPQAGCWIGTAAAILQPQQHRIWAASVTYTTARSKAGSLTHWTRPGIKPASTSSWILVGFVTAEPQRELPLP